MNQKRSETLIKKVDNNTEALIQRLTNMIALSASTSTQEVQASEMLQIEYSASMIVRLVEELLSVSRTLKENWILGQLPKPNEHNGKDVMVGIEDKMNEVLTSILRTKNFEEEAGDDISEDEADDVDDEEEEEVLPQVKVEDIAALDSLVPDVIIAEPVTTTKSEPVHIKVEPTVSSTPQTEQTTTQAKTEPIPPTAPIDQPVTIPDTIDMTDTANMLGDYDFDNFGSMDDQENDIIMID